MFKVSRKRLLYLISSATTLAFLGGTPGPVASATRNGRISIARVTLTAEQRAQLRDASKMPLPRPDGIATQISSDSFEYHGVVTFRMPYRHMSGRARSVVWRADEAQPALGQIRINLAVAAGQSYPLQVVPDMTNTLVSRLVVD